MDRNDRLNALADEIRKRPGVSGVTVNITPDGDFTHYALYVTGTDQTAVGVGMRDLAQAAKSGGPGVEVPHQKDLAMSDQAQEQGTYRAVMRFVLRSPGPNEEARRRAEAQRGIVGTEERSELEIRRAEAHAKAMGHIPRGKHE